MFPALSFASTQGQEKADYFTSPTEEVEISGATRARRIVQSSSAILKTSRQQQQRTQQQQEKATLWRIFSPIRKREPTSPFSKESFPPPLPLFDAESDTYKCSESDDSYKYERDSARVVRFDTEISYKYTLSRVDYTDKEIKSCWIDENCLKRTILNAHKSVEKFNSGNTKVCIRGLEVLTEKGRDECKRNKNDGIVAVLNEQDYQFLSQYDDPDEIAELYEEAGYYARKEARERAKIRKITDRPAGIN